MRKSRLKWLAIPLLCLLLIALVALPVGAQEVTVVRSISPSSIVPGGTATITVTITTTEEVSVAGLIETVPLGWAVKPVEKAGALFEFYDATGEAVWFWTTLAAGSTTITYELTAPKDAAFNDYPISGRFRSATPSVDMPVGGDNTISVVEEVLAPATCDWANLMVNPTEGVAPLEITASADVTNNGDVAGECTAELKVDGAVVATQTVTVAAKATETVTFTYKLTDPGTYRVTINELDPVTVNVTEAPAFLTFADWLVWRFFK